MTGWRAVAATCVLLAVPTAVAPRSAVAGVAYLVGMVLVGVAVTSAALRGRPADRGPWRLLAAATLCWLGGDVVQRALAAAGHGSDRAGAPDVLWLASYPLVVAAVVSMVRRRGLPRPLVVEIALDVVVAGAAAAVIAWHLLVAPALGEQGAVLDRVVWSLYPLGDVVIFAFAITLLLAPGRRGAPGRLLVACLAMTLPVDVLTVALPRLTPGVDTARLDAALLVANGLLAAAALHPGRHALTAAVGTLEPAPMSRWRVGLLGGSLVVVSVMGALPTTRPGTVAASLGAAVVMSATVVLRFYRLVQLRERAEADLRHRAHHDDLTGVANRSLLLLRLDALVAAAPAPDSPGPVPAELSVALVFVDLDGFKTVNDTHGHPAGDAVLRAVAGRLAALVRPQDTVARVGGDEFVVLLRGVDRARATALAEAAAEAVGTPVTLEGGAVARVGASIGVHWLPAPPHLPDLPGAASTLEARTRCVDDLLRTADTAMYGAKRSGGGVRHTLGDGLVSPR